MDSKSKPSSRPSSRQFLLEFLNPKVDSDIIAEGSCFCASSFTVKREGSRVMGRLLLVAPTYMNILPQYNAYWMPSAKSSAHFPVTVTLNRSLSLSTAHCHSQPLRLTNECSSRSTHHSPLPYLICLLPTPLSPGQCAALIFPLSA
jgi:hypothetical protein